jgi:pimeloyl-ACP methyl ester carboxylesterase
VKAHHPVQHSVNVEDRTFRYVQYNDPDATVTVPVLLLHPWFGWYGMWSQVMSELEQPGLAVDWYSLGDQGPEPFGSPVGLARAAVALLDALRLAQVDVVGNSVGGIVAQIIAARYPGRVRRLVLVGTGASLSGAPTRFGQLVAQWISQSHRRVDLTPQLVDALTFQPQDPGARAANIEAVTAAAPAFVSAVLESARRLDLRPELMKINAPTLVIRGEHDSARTCEHVRDLLSGIQGSRAVEMPRTGHSPMVEDAPAFCRYLREHLEW